MNKINVWDNVHDDFNIKYMENKKQKKLMENILQSHVIFKCPSEPKEYTLKKSKKSIINNNSL